MSQIITILDACTVINLIHIDSEDEFLIKKLKHLNIHICEYVYKEIKTNVFKQPSYTNVNKEYLKDERQKINNILPTFLNYKMSDSIVLENMGKGFYLEVNRLSNYNKKNGEFYSSALALYLSQCEPTKLFFYTDDYPAKKDFSFFYDLHQIGGIKDTADLLLLLYRLDEHFSKKELIRLLSSLLSRYTTDTTIFLSELKKYSIPSTLIKDRKFNDNLRKLINSIESYSFGGINDIKSFFTRNRNSRYKGVINILNQHKGVFGLEFNSNNYLDKIKHLINYLKNNDIYKFVC